VGVAHKGFSAAEIVMHGRAAHGSRPAEGKDAILRMGRVLAKLEAEDRALQGQPATDPFVPDTTPIPASLRSEISRRMREQARMRSHAYRDEPQTADN